MDTQYVCNQPKIDSILAIRNGDRVVWYWLVSLVCLSVLSVVFQSVGIVLIGIVGITIFTLSAKGISRRDWRRFTTYTFIAFLFMIVVYCGLIEKYGEPFYGGDDKLFEEYGENLYSSGIFRFKAVPYIQGMTYAKGYLTIIAWIYRLSAPLGGYSTISPRVLNLYLWLATVVMVYKQILKHQENSDIAQKFLPLVALYPNALFILSCVYRDTMVTFFLVLGMVSFEEIVASIKLSGIKEAGKIFPRAVCFIIGTYLLRNIRPQMVYVLLVICVLYLVWGKLRLSLEKKLLLFGGAAVVAFVLFKYSGGMNLLKLIMDSYSDYRIAVNDGMTGRIFSMSLLPFGFIARFFYGMICPFPGGVLSLPYFDEPIFSIIMLLIYLGTIFQFFMMPYILRGIIKMDYYTFRFLVVYCAIIITTFTFRHFIMIYPFAMSAICGQVSEVKTVKKKRWRVIMVIVLVCAAVAYIALKMV